MALKTQNTPEGEKSSIDHYYDRELSPVERTRSEQARGLRKDSTTPQDLKSNEEKTGKASSSEPSADIRSREQQGGWDNKYQQRDSAPRRVGLKGVLNKKNGPMGLIIALLLGGGFGLFTLLSPSLLLVHMTEKITEKMNTQLPGMEMRANSILFSKLSDKATSGFCKGAVNVRCKYSSMSDKQLKQFKDAGIEVVTEDKTTISGRHKPTEFKFNDKSIKAADFTRELSTNQEFSAAVRKAYNPKFAGFADKTWGKLAARFRLSKKAPFDENIKNDEERTKRLEEETKHGQNSGTTGKKYVQNDKGEWVEEGCTQNCTPVDEATAKAHNNANGIKQGAEDVTKSGKKAASTTLAEAEEAIEAAAGNASGSALTKATRFLSITGIADTACGAYGAIQAVAYGAKVIRAVQMARYAMVFLTTASMIKSGDARPDDVAYLGTILTKTVNTKTTDANGKEVTTVSKSATDSYGYKYVAYGDAGPLTVSATQFLAGGGLGGKMSGVLDRVMSVLGGKKNAQKVCKTVQNPYVQAGSLIAGVALMIIPGGGLVIGAKDIAQGALAVAISAAMIVLPDMLKDIVAGILVDNNTYGEAAGDAIVSGSGSMMSSLAAMGGNAPLHPEQAVAYSNLQNKVLAKYAEEDRLAYSPLDASNPNTFMGKVAGQLVPYSSQLSSLSGVITTSASIVTRSLSTILSPSTFAANKTSDYTQCQDYDYRAMEPEKGGLATDPFCNPIRGIPPEYLESDPIELASRLISSGDIDETTGQPKSEEYKKFIADCIDRERPLGDTGQSFDEDDGTKCFIDNQKEADYYVYHIDQRVLDGMEEGYLANSIAGASTTSGSTPGSDVTGDDYGNGGCQALRQQEINASGSSGLACDGQCVDFVKFRLKKHVALDKFDVLSDGWQVAATLGAKYGYKVDNKPAVHAVVSWPRGSGVSAQYGHTAMVSAVNPDGSIVVEDYNWKPLTYSSHTVDASTAAGLTYAHTEVDYK